MLQRYLLIWLTVSSGIAFAWPSLAGPYAAYDPFTASKDILPWLIVVTMFALGWLLPVDEIKQVGQRWPAVIGGTLIQYLSMPSLAWLIGTAFGFRGDHLLGIILVGCVPGAMASNVVTLLARGNTSYSISLTTMATLASPLAVPLSMWIAMRGQTVDATVFWKSSVGLFLTVVLPVVLGFGISKLFPRWEEIARKIGSAVAALAILWIIAVVVGINREKLSGLSPTLFLSLLLINLGGYAAGFGGGWLMRIPDSMRRALTLEVGMQNAGLGATLAVTLFPEQPLTALAPALYTFACMFTGVILAQIWSARPVHDPAGLPAAQGKL